MHFLTKTADGISPIFFFVSIIYGGKHLLHGSIPVDELFEANQFGNQIIHLRGGFCRGHEEKNVIEVAFFRNDSVFPEIVGQNRAGNAEVRIFSRFNLDAGRYKLKLHRVDKILIFAVSFESVPFCIRFKGPVGQIVGHSVGISVFPLFPVNRSGDKRTDIPAVFQNFFPGLDDGFYRLEPELSAGFSFVHLCVDIESGEELVEGRRGGVHHEGIVELLMGNIASLSPDVSIFLVNLTGHGEAGLLLMDGLCDEDTGIFRTEFQKQRTAVLHHGDELFIADPGGVKEDVVAEMADAVHNLTGVVDGAVVGSQLDDSKTDRAFGLCFFRILFCDKAADIVFPEAVLRDAADGTVGIAGGFQIYRCGSCQDKRAVIDGLMVVPVEKDDVPGSQSRVQNDFIGRRGAVQHKIGFVRMIDLCGVLLGSQGRALMNEKIAHGYVCIAQICTERIFSEKFIEGTACRSFPEKSTALVAGAVELGVSVFHILFQIPEERGKHLVFIVNGSAFNPADIKIAVGFSQIDDQIDFPQVFRRYGVPGSADQDEGNAEGRNHFLGKDVFIVFLHEHGGYIGKVCIIDGNRIPSGDGAENFQRFVGISNFHFSQKNPSLGK